MERGGEGSWDSVGPDSAVALAQTNSPVAAAHSQPSELLLQLLPWLPQWLQMLRPAAKNTTPSQSHPGRVTFKILARSTA